MLTKEEMSAKQSEKAKFNGFLGNKSLEYLIVQQEITKRGGKTLKGFKQASDIC